MEEGEDYVKSLWLLWLGPHTCYNSLYNVLLLGDKVSIIKVNYSTDCRLQLVYMKQDSVVISNQHVEVKSAIRFVQTARQLWGFSVYPKLKIKDNNTTKDNLYNN